MDKDIIKETNAGAVAFDLGSAYAAFFATASRR